MEKQELFKILEQRFLNNMHRHPNHNWDDVVSAIDNVKLKALMAMELSGGEVDVVDLNNNNQQIIFVDCSKESPTRRSFCYDHEALNKRKDNKPINSAINFAEDNKVSLLNESEYRRLQSFEKFDLKTSSWILTPVEIRALGGALFCDNRYNQVFVYHNGADSYYSARGFRTKLEL